jgi:hypothetical protein
MSISPFPAPRPGSPAQEGRRARLVVLLVILGISASLLAYAISPGVRHAVSHAAHSVGHVIDRDKNEHKSKTHTVVVAPRHPATTTPAAKP